MLFYHHKSAGSIDRNSDNKSFESAFLAAPENKEFRAQGITRNIIWSTRLNVEQVIQGSESYTM